MNGEANITERHFRFTGRIVKLCRFLEKQGKVCYTLSNQLLRAGTCIGVNIEEAQAGQSKADFAAKMSIAGKEPRETFYWLRLLSETEIVAQNKLQEIMRESDELVRILTTIVKTAQTGGRYAK